MLKIKKCNNLQYYDDSEIITKLNHNQIFVFGSNLLGKHGAGAAASALKHFGAIYNKGVGIQGQSYAIPTISVLKPYTRLELSIINKYVKDFILYTEKVEPKKEYLLTPIGTGLAGYNINDIYNMFAIKMFHDDNNKTSNIIYPSSFINLFIE